MCSCFLEDQIPTEPSFAGDRTVKGYIFRKVALDRLSSPEQLDELLRVSNTRSWLAFIALLALIAVSIVWACTGSIPVTTSGSGIIVRTGGVLNVVSPTSGVLLELKGRVGDEVEKGQVVARIAQPELLERLKAARAVLFELRNQRLRSATVGQNERDLQIAAISRQRENVKHTVEVLTGQLRLASEQVRVATELLAKGLITDQQRIAAEEKQAAIQGQIDALHAQLKQIDADEYLHRMQPVQTDAEMQQHVADQERTVAALEQELTLNTNVVTVYAGEVLEVKVQPGASVTVGTPILSMQPREKQLELLFYVPHADAKDVRTGMDVEVSPSTVKRSEFGYMKGKTTYVSAYPSTPQALMTNFQNEVLVNTLTHNGPVTEIRVRLQEDARTHSGFAWSSSRGPLIDISSGTFCSGRIITRIQRPITLVVPFLKDKLGAS
jgi:HlyD family secretion protein